MYSHPECYAAALQNCSKNITREHIISESVLKHLAQDDKGKPKLLLHTTGLPWQERGVVTPLASNNNTFAPRILCHTHNNALKDLDAAHAKLVACLSQVPDFFFSCGDEKAIKTHHFKGKELERYVLKELCGFIAAGNAVAQTGLDKDKTVDFTALPTVSLELLFGLRGFPDNDGSGLYIKAHSIERQMAPMGVGLKPLGVPPNITGCIKAIHNLEFLLALFPVKEWVQQDRNKCAALMKDNVHRPGALNFIEQVSDRQFQIIFDWEDGLEHKPITYPVLVRSSDTPPGQQGFFV